MRRFWLRLTLLLLVLLILGGSVEIAIHHYDPTRIVYRRLKADDPYLYDKIDPKLVSVRAADLIGADVVDAPERVRARLLQMIWGGSNDFATELPDRVAMGDDGKLGTLPAGTTVARMHFDLGLALTSNPYLLTPPDRNGRLVIYHHGFGNPIESVDHLLGAILNAGFDIIAVNALGHGGTLAFVDSDQDGILPHARGKRKSNIFHEMSHFDRPLRYHLRPVLGALRYARSKSDYRTVDIVGFSMGGFMAMLIAAIKPSIERSYPIAGVYPNYMRRGQEVMSDGPPAYPPLMDIANHLELFVLGSTGPGRRQLQIFNRYDRCCFNGIRSELYQQAVGAAVALTPAPGQFEIIVDETHADHRISKFATRTIVEDLLRGR